MQNPPFTQLRKRDGRLVDFDSNRIKIAIEKALKATECYNPKIAETLNEDVLNSLASYKGQFDTPDLEFIQDMVENAFIRRGMTKAAKAFILYRAQHESLRKSREILIDIQNLVAAYLDKNDWRVNENSNAGYSYASLLNHISGSIVALLWKMYIQKK